MGWVDWSKMTQAQRLEATAMRPAFHFSDFRKFEFWIKPDGHVSKRKGGGSHQLNEAAYNEQVAKYYGPTRSKGDNREWKPGVTFHFSRD